MEAVLLSLRVTGVALLFLVPLGLLAAWKMAQRKRGPLSLVFDTLLSLPLILPPTVAGYALLLLFGRQTPMGVFLQDVLHINIVLTWYAAVLASFLMAFPLFVRTVAAAFASVDSDLLEAGRTLGATEFHLFYAVLIPLAWRGVLAGGTLAFARALGEFGATFMIAGAMSGETETLPIALYNAVQGGSDTLALRYAALLTTLSFVFLLFVQWLMPPEQTRTGR